MKRAGFLLALPAAGLAALSGARAAEPSPEVKEAIEQIEANGGTARPIAQNDDRLDVDFHLSGESVSDDSIAAVARLKNVHRLHLGGTAVSDAGLAHIAGLTTLEKLHLEKSKITDEGLRHLAGLENLSYLNLYGTAVSDAGMEHLKGLKKLEKLYLWQTEVTGAGAASLQAALPNVTIDRGWDLAETEKIGEAALRPEAEEDKKEKKEQ